MLQHEFGLAKSTVKPWRERIDQGGVGAMDRPRRNSRYPREFKLRVVEAYLRGEGDCRALALEHGVRNGAQTRDRAKRRRGGGDDAPVVHPPGRRRKEPAGEEALDRRCARLEMEVEILRRTAASAAALSAAGGSTRQRSRRGGNIRSPRSWSPSGCRAPPIAATGRAPSGRRATERPAIAGICEKSRFGYGCRRVADALRKAAGVRIADKAALKAVREEGPLLRARRRRRRRFRMGRAGKSPRTCRPATSGRRARWPSRRPTSPNSGRAARSPAFRPWSTPAATRSSPARYPGPRAWRRSPGCRRASRAGPMAETPRRRIRTWAGSTGCPPIGSRSSGRGSPGPCPAKETASTTRRPRTSSRWPRPSLATIGRDGPDVFEGDPEKHIDRYSNVRIKRRLDGSGPVEYGLGRAA